MCYMYMYVMCSMYMYVLCSMYMFVLCSMYMYALYSMYNCTRAAGVVFLLTITIHDTVEHYITILFFTIIVQISEMWV